MQATSDQVIYMLFDIRPHICCYKLHLESYKDVVLYVTPNNVSNTTPPSATQEAVTRRGKILLNPMGQLSRSL